MSMYSKLEMLNYEKENGYLKDGYIFIVVGKPEIQDDNIGKLIFNGIEENQNNVIVDYFDLFDLDYSILFTCAYNAILEFQEKYGKTCKLYIGLANNEKGICTSGIILESQLNYLKKMNVNPIKSVINTVIKEFKLEVCLTALKNLSNKTNKN